MATNALEARSCAANPTRNTMLDAAIAVAHAAEANSLALMETASTIRELVEHSHGMPDAVPGELAVRH